MKDDDFKLLRGFDNWQTDKQINRQTDKHTNRQTDICECRVTFATENYFFQPAFNLHDKDKVKFVQSEEQRR